MLKQSESKRTHLKHPCSALRLEFHRAVVQIEPVALLEVGQSSKVNMPEQQIVDTFLLIRLGTCVTASFIGLFTCLNSKDHYPNEGTSFVRILFV